MTLLRGLGNFLGLRFDPLPVLIYKRTQLLFRLFPILEAGKSIHGKLNIANRRRFNLLHFGIWNPASANQLAADAILPDRFCSHVVTNGVFAIIAVLQIGNAVIPIVAGGATQVRAAKKLYVGVDFKLDLKGESLITSFIGCFRSAVHHKDGDSTSPRWHFRPSRQNAYRPG